MYVYTIQSLRVHTHIKYMVSVRQLGLNLGRIIPKTQKMVLDASLLNTQ